MIYPLHPVQSAILEILGNQPKLKMPELHQRISKNCKQNVSLPNLYRTVSQLIDEQVLIKSKGALSLNIVWASLLVNMGKTIEHNYLKSEDEALDIRLEEGERRVFYAESIMSLDKLWNHLLIQITGLFKAPIWYAYQAHPWCSLGQINVTSGFTQSLVQRGGRLYLLYGNTSYLDKYGSKLIAGYKQNVLVHDRPPFLKDRYFLWICEDYIVEGLFPESVSRHFDVYFKSVTAIEQFDPELFADIFKMRVKCKLTLRRSRKEATENIRKIMKFFG